MDLIEDHLVGTRTYVCDYEAISSLILPSLPPFLPPPLPPYPFNVPNQIRASIKHRPQNFRRHDQTRAIWIHRDVSGYQTHVALAEFLLLEGGREGGRERGRGGVSERSHDEAEAMGIHRDVPSYQTHVALLEGGR